ncbi:hypothetical protein ELAK_29260 [Elizabethkingia anophelis]|nr:hypothetical protein ELAK_29260 [Elizabethkingia anophelis]HDP3255307.1 hypothetical protein [Elizabethkingia anophelis]
MTFVEKTGLTTKGSLCKSNLQSKQIISAFCLYLAYSPPFKTKQDIIYLGAPDRTPEGKGCYIQRG